MMDNLRAASNSVVLKVILALIIVSFVLTGVGGYLGDSAGGYAAEVNGQEIDRVQFEQAVYNERNRLQQQLGDQFSQLASNEDFMKQMRQQVLNRMINDLLLDQYAANIGLAIGDDQVKLAIQSSPEFATNGQFDNSKYRELLSRFQIAPEQYAEMLRKQLLTEQLLTAFSGSNFVLPTEADAIIALVYQQRDVRLANIDMQALAAKQDAEPSAQEIAAFYEQNKHRFTTPESVKVNYIGVDAASLAEGLTVSEKEIADFYQQNKPLYQQNPRFDYSIIVLETESEAKNVLEQLHNGADFATLAKEKSTEKETAAKGGNIGWLESAAVPDEIAAARLTEKGALSGVIDSALGYLIVRLNDSEAAKEKPLNDVKAEITQTLLQDKSYDKYEDLQIKLIEGAANNKLSLDEAEKASGLKAIQTDWFTRDNMPEELAYSEIAQVVFGGELFGANGAPGPNSELITVDGDRAFIVRITEHRPEAVKSLETVSSEIHDLLKHQNVVRMAQEQAEQLLTKLKAENNEDALRAANIMFSGKQTLTRMAEDMQLADSVFSLPPPKEGKPVYAVSTDKNDNVVLIALDDIHPGQLDEEQTRGFKAELARQDSGIILDALIASLREQAKIKMGDSLDMLY